MKLLLARKGWQKAKTANGLKPGEMGGKPITFINLLKYERKKYASLQS